jgi:hypothetical protein
MVGGARGVYLRLINLKGKEFVFNRINNSNRTDRIAEKVVLRKLNFFIFVSHSLPGWPNAVVVCRPPSSSPLVVRCSILRAVVIRHLCCPPLSSSAIAVLAHHCHRCPPPPYSAAASIITTPLSLPSLTALSRPSPLQSATQSCVSSSSATVAICYCCCLPSPYLCLPSLLP